jgi:hypothetical protein
MILSCLHLGFYLASWGMFRPSSDLPSRSLKQFEPVVALIARIPGDIWAIDAHCYSEAVCAKIISTVADIQEALRHPNGAWPTRTLATKVMLGVFGNVPAFDTRVVAGLRKTRLTGRFGIRALQDIGRFYREHGDVIEHYRECTLDFATGHPTYCPYTRAKVIDEISFIEGRGSVGAFWAKRHGIRFKNCGPGPVREESSMPIPRTSLSRRSGILLSSASANPIERTSRSQHMTSTARTDRDQTLSKEPPIWGRSSSGRLVDRDGPECWQYATGAGSSRCSGVDGHGNMSSVKA